LIIGRYLFVEILYTLLALIALLLLIYISHRFMVYLIQASSGALPPEFILQVLVIRLLSDLVLILPLGFFLSVLLVLGRLYKDNEITALAACGIPLPVTSILIAALLFASIVGTLSLGISPWAKGQMENLKVKISSFAEVGGIAAGRFKEFIQGNGIFYVETIDADDNTMTDVFVQANLPDKQVILVAKRGYQTLKADQLFMVLVDGRRYENKRGSLSYTVTEFAEHSLRVPKRLDTPQGDNRTILATHLLWGTTNTAYQAELQWRLSLPLSVILLAILAVPLAHTTPRQGQYAKIFVGVLIYLIYNNMLNVAQKLVERGDLPVWIGVWLIHAGLALIILILFRLPYLREQYLIIRTQFLNSLRAHF